MNDTSLPSHLKADSVSPEIVGVVVHGFQKDLSRPTLQQIYAVQRPGESPLKVGVDHASCTVLINRFGGDALTTCVLVVCHNKRRISESDNDSTSDFVSAVCEKLSLQPWTWHKCKRGAEGSNLAWMTMYTLADACKIL